MQNYALRVVREGVDVKILTGAKRLRNKSTPGHSASGASPGAEDTTAPLDAHGVHLLAQLRHIQGTLTRGAPEVFVMPGSSKPLFHDRFVVIDDVVWASGPSFNELGERIGLISPGLRDPIGQGLGLL